MKDLQTMLLNEFILALNNNTNKIIKEPSNNKDGSYHTKILNSNNDLIFFMDNISNITKYIKTKLYSETISNDGFNKRWNYNENGNLISEHTINEFIYHKYDSKNRRVRTDTFNSDGSVFVRKIKFINNIEYFTYYQKVNNKLIEIKK